MSNVTSQAMEGRTAIGLKEWLFDPFTYVAGAKSLALGLAAILLAGLVGSFSNSHFDGVLDFHTGFPAGTGVFLIEGVVAWLSLAVILFILGKLVSKTAFRAIDLFGTQAMARWPSLLIALAALAPPYQRYLGHIAAKLKLTNVGGGVSIYSTDAVFFGFLLVIIVLAVVWMVALMYRAYTVCCNIKGAKAIATFIGGLLAAEVVGKLVLLRVAMR